MGSSRGLIGLTADVGKREQANQDIATLGKMLALKKQGEAEERQAQATEEAYYDRIRQQADSLLSGDRKAINDKAKRLQVDIKSKIKLFGGSKRKFMAAGGMENLSSYTNGVLNSDELQTYKQNKTNLERILDIKEKKLGHLLSEADQKSLDEYNRNGRGTISYGGLLNEIIIPDKDLYDYGHITTPLEILQTDNNQVRILANYLQENPNKTEADAMKPKVLEDYVHYKGWSGRGNNTKALQYKAQQSSNNSKNTATSSVTGAYHTFLANQKTISISKIDDDYWKMKGLLDETIGGVLQSKWNKVGQKSSTLGMDLIGWIPGVDDDNNYRLKGARDLGMTSALAAFKTMNGGDDNYTIEKGLVKDFDMRASKGLLWADGTPVDTSNTSPNFDLKIKGLAMAWQITKDDGSTRLLMEGITENGDIDNDRTNKMNSSVDAENEVTASPVMVLMYDYDAALSPDDNSIYQVVDFMGTQNQAKFKEHMGSFDNTTKVIKEANQDENLLNRSKELAKKEVKFKQETEAKSGIQNGAFERELFSMQINRFNSIPGGNNRSNLMKAFYLALNDEKGSDIESLIYNDVFGKEFEASGLFNQLKESITDEDIFLKYIQKEIKLDPSNRDQAAIIYKRTLNYLSKINNPEN